MDRKEKLQNKINIIRSVKFQKIKKVLIYFHLKGKVQVRTKRSISHLLYMPNSPTF